jgi:transcriptional regulator with XRE-family HTH domain
MSMQHVRKRTDAGDAEIGRRVRVRRLQKGITQTELGALIGVTFQQVQKYEKGINRVASGRLRRIADVLEVPLSFFFDGDEHNKKADVVSPLDFLTTEGAIRLVRAFSQIGDANARVAAVNILEHMAAVGAPGRKSAKR